MDDVSDYEKAQNQSGGEAQVLFTVYHWNAAQNRTHFLKGFSIGAFITMSASFVKSNEYFLQFVWNLIWCNSLCTEGGRRHKEFKGINCKNNQLIYGTEFVKSDLFLFNPLTQISLYIFRAPILATSCSFECSSSADEFWDASQAPTKGLTHVSNELYMEIQNYRKLCPSDLLLTALTISSRVALPGRGHMLYFLQQLLFIGTFVSATSAASLLQIPSLTHKKELTWECISPNYLLQNKIF